MIRLNATRPGATREKGEKGEAGEDGLPGLNGRNGVDGKEGEKLGIGGPATSDKAGDQQLAVVAAAVRCCTNTS